MKVRLYSGLESLPAWAQELVYNTALELVDVPNVRWWKDDEKITIVAGYDRYYCKPDVEWVI